MEDLLESRNDASIIRMLNALLTQAAKYGASDIHIEPYERSSAGAFPASMARCVKWCSQQGADGGAHLAPLRSWPSDISEKRLPQDGRISLRIGGRAVDVRVLTLPSAHGERAVLRILEQGDTRKSPRTRHQRRHVDRFSAPASAARHRAGHRSHGLWQQAPPPLRRLEHGGCRDHHVLTVETRSKTSCLGSVRHR